MTKKSKLIITNGVVLKEKYPDFEEIEKGLNQWIEADNNKDVVSTLAPIDSAAFMGSIGSKPVQNWSDLREIKRAIDDLHVHLKPDYAVILGSTDIVPHQQLINLVEDDDPFIASDLPYCCDAPFSQHAEAFRFPTRALTRLPNLTGTRDSKHLASLLRVTGRQFGRPRGEYNNYFAVSADMFRGSTSASLRALFNNDRALED